MNYELRIKNMKIELTNEQYENLIRLVYLGNWMINAIRSGNKNDERIEKYDEIEQYIFSFAKEAGLEKYIEFDKKYNKYFPSGKFEEDTDIKEYIEDYDNEVFWQELADKLGNRDFYKKYGEGIVKKMSQEERFLKEQELIIKYEEEIERSGIDNLEIKKIVSGLV